MFKSFGNHFAKLRARKSISSLFGLTGRSPSPTPRYVDSIQQHQVKADQSPRFVETLNGTVTCLEAQHYPIYDSTNPAHEPRALALAQEQSTSASIPDLAEPQKQSSPPQRLSSSSMGTRSKLQGFADSVRAKTNRFSEAHRASSREDLRCQKLTPSLAASSANIICKKSVRFRSGLSLIDHVDPPMSPDSAVCNPSPSLSLGDLSSDQDEIFAGLIWAQPEQPLPTLTSSSQGGDSRNHRSVELEPRSSAVPQLPTLISDTSLFNGDPFRDYDSISGPELPSFREELAQEARLGSQRVNRWNSEFQYDADTEAEPSDYSEGRENPGKDRRTKLERNQQQFHTKHTHDSGSKSDLVKDQMHTAEKPPKASAGAGVVLPDNKRSSESSQQTVDSMPSTLTTDSTPTSFETSGSEDHSVSINKRSQSPRPASTRKLLNHPAGY
jgi:hypothetical protein